MMSDFVTDNNIIAFFSAILNPKGIAFDITTLPSFIRTAAYQEVVQRSQCEWVAKNETIWLDGIRSKKIVLDPCKVPIVRIDSISIIREDATEVSLNIDQSSETRSVSFNEETGIIEFIRSPDITVEFALDEDDIQPYFPDGTKNIKIVGVFGTSNPDYILKMLQLFTMLRSLSYLNPSMYATGDIISETIGKYRYELAGKGSSNAGSRMSLDELISYYYTLLPGHGFAYEAI